MRAFSTAAKRLSEFKGIAPKHPSEARLTHLTSSGSAHMVPISHKEPTSRTAIAVASVYFSNSTAIKLIQENNMKKGDVLGVARIAGIMAAKKTSDLIPLCHPISISHVSVELGIVEPDSAVQSGIGPRKTETGQGNTDKLAKSQITPDNQGFGRISITATVSCDGKTGVEMEALTAASAAALTVYDMCKAVDKSMRIADLRVVHKEGGKSGTWIEGSQA
jgi:molybdenum cofactor biosynthesis protein MoaC